MAAPLEVGNAIIHPLSPDDPKRSGLTTGYLEYYDERHRPAFPLTTQAMCVYLQAIWTEPSVPSLWKAGRIAGCIEAVCENETQTFRSFTPQERECMTVLQQA